MNRNKRAIMAQETLKILENGVYKTASGKPVDLSNDLNVMKEKTQLYRPEDFPVEIPVCYSVFETIVEVTAETTLQAAERLRQENTDEVMCLNFASAKNPGGRPTCPKQFSKYV